MHGMAWRGMAAQPSKPGFPSQLPSPRPGTHAPRAHPAPKACGASLLGCALLATLLQLSFLEMWHVGTQQKQPAVPGSRRRCTLQQLAAITGHNLLVSNETLTLLQGDARGLRR